MWTSSSGPTTQVTCLLKKIGNSRRLHAALGDVVGVVEPDRQELARLDRREQADLVERDGARPRLRGRRRARLRRCRGRGPRAGVEPAELHDALRELDGRLLGRVAAGHRLRVDLLEAQALGAVGRDLLGVDELADRVGLELRRRCASTRSTSPSRRRCRTGARRGCRRDRRSSRRTSSRGRGRMPATIPASLQPQVAGVQLVERSYSNAEWCMPGVGLLLGVVDEVGEREQRDPVVRLVVGQPGAEVVTGRAPRRRRASSTSRSSPAAGSS